MAKITINTMNGSFQECIEFKREFDIFSNRIPKVFRRTTIMVLCLFFLFLCLGFTHSADPFPRNESTRELSTGVSYPRIDPTKVTRISWHPRAFVYKGFLTDEECDHLINLGDNLDKAMVATENGTSILSPVRTSSGQFLLRAQDKVVADIEARVAAWTMLPEENGEPIQILRYQEGEKYDQHYDYFFDKYNKEYGGQRIATVLMYLSNVKKGGETAFPESDDTQPKDDSWSECAKKGIAVKPTKGDALLFFDVKLNVTLDTFSLHRGCPVIEGEKWSATKWIHVASFQKPYKPVNPDCSDNDDDCVYWAANGECDKNPVYMIGSEGTYGECRKSCNAC